MCVRVSYGALHGLFGCIASDLWERSKSAFIFMVVVMLRHDPISAMTYVLLTLAKRNLNDFLVRHRSYQHQTNASHSYAVRKYSGYIEIQSIV